MNVDHSLVNTSQSTSDMIARLTTLVASTVKKDLRWYQRATLWSMIAQRFCGVIVLVLGASLPIIASWEFRLQWKNFIVSTIGVSIALISGLNTFFGFGEAWKRHMQAAVDLKNQLAIWELRMAEAASNNNIQERNDKAVRATETLLETVTMIDNRVTKEFLEQFNFPNSKPT